jgi:hypothetical protein
MQFSDVAIIGRGSSDNSCKTSLDLYKYLQSMHKLLYFEHEAPLGRLGKGYMYYIATDKGKKEWKNAHESGSVRVTVSSKSSISGYSNESDVVNHEYPGIFSTSNERDEQDDDQWVTIDLLNNAPICPNHYALSAFGDSGGHGFEIRNWLFQGSNNNQHWTTLRKHENDTSMSCNNDHENEHVGSWKIENCTTFYRYFRIFGVGKQEHPKYNMLGLGGFEIYGKVAKR